MNTATLSDREQRALDRIRVRYGYPSRFDTTQTALMSRPGHMIFDDISAFTPAIFPEPHMAVPSRWRQMVPWVVVGMCCLAFVAGVAWAAWKVGGR